MKGFNRAVRRAVELAKRTHHDQHLLEDRGRLITVDGTHLTRANGHYIGVALSEGVWIDAAPGELHGSIC